jgi:hypothetical protein
MRIKQDRLVIPAMRPALSQSRLGYGVISCFDKLSMRGLFFIAYSSLILSPSKDEDQAGPTGHSRNAACTFAKPGWGTA